MRRHVLSRIWAVWILALPLVILQIGSAGAAPISPAELFLDPNRVPFDFYSRVELPSLSADNDFRWSAGADAVVGARILPILKPGDYPSSYVFSNRDYLQVPGVDYVADLTSGSLTVTFDLAGLYHVEVIRASGLDEIFSVFAETDLKEKTGPDKTGASKKLDPLPDADLFLVERSDSTLDDSAAIWEAGGRTVQRVTSRADAIDKIKAKSRELGRKIHVEIDGHGTMANISTGAGKENIADKQIDLSSVADFQKAVDPYVNYITFQGCSVGAGADGEKFLKILSDSIGKASAWNLPVNVVDRSYFTIGKDARFVTKDKEAIPLARSFVLVGAGFVWLVVAGRKTAP